MASNRREMASIAFRTAVRSVSGAGGRTWACSTRTRRSSMAVRRARMFSRATEMAATEAVKGAGVAGVGDWSVGGEAAGSLLLLVKGTFQRQLCV